MTASYTALTQYWRCPRSLGFRRLGYDPVVRPEALQTGQFVHLGLAAFFRGQNVSHILQEARAAALLILEKLQDKRERMEEMYKIKEAMARAHSLLSRHIAYWAKDYTATLSELELELDGVVAHPDLVATYAKNYLELAKGGTRVLVEFKTSKSPDLRAYDLSGQADLYAYILRQLGTPVELVVYDIISDEGLYRHTRPPNLVRGLYLFGAIQDLGLKEKRGDNLLLEPHYSWECPRCDWFLPCYLMETDGDWRDYLERNFLKEAK